MLPAYRKPTHPGEVLLEEFLNPLNVTQKKLADHLEWTVAKVNEIINGKRGVTPESALAFADAFGTTPDFWLNLQYMHDLWEAQQHHKPVPKFA